MNDAINHMACETLFTQARTHNGWLDKPVSDAQLQAVWDLMKMGPTSANCSPARIVFVRSAEGKEKLRLTLSSGNLQKTMQAPVTAIVAWDSAFYDRLPTLFPHGDARSWFTSSPQLAEETAFRNSSLQAAYLIFACRALQEKGGSTAGDITVNAPLIIQGDVAGDDKKFNEMLKKHANSVTQAVRSSQRRNT